MKRSAEKQFSELYLSNLDIIGEGLPASVNAARGGYLEALMLAGLPGTGQGLAPGLAPELTPELTQGLAQEQGRDQAQAQAQTQVQTQTQAQAQAHERYRHFDARGMLSGEREYFFTPQKFANQKFADQKFTGQKVANASPGDFEPEGYVVRLRNGFSGGDLRVLDNGIIYGSLREAMSRFPDITLKHYNTVADNDGELLAALSSVFMQDGAFVYIPDGVEAEEPFFISFDYASDEPAQMCFARALIVAGDNARARVFVSHCAVVHVLGADHVANTVDDTAFTVDCVCETVAGPGAQVEMTQMSAMNDRSTLIVNKYFRQQSDSKVDMQSVWLGGGATRVNSDVRLEGRGAQSNYYALYFGSGAQRTDLDMAVRHLVPDCESFQLVKGVVSGDAVGAFTGLVYVAPDAQRTVAMQQNRNLQLSASSKVYAEPRLEIYADDVKCSHGATIGQMDDAAVYYMRQRGLSEADARKLQMSGFVNDVISRCSVEQVRRYIDALAQRRIDEM